MPLGGKAVLTRSVLQLLSERPNLSCGMISRLLGSNKSSVAWCLKSLERKGLVKRVSVPYIIQGFKRECKQYVNLWSLTSKGAEAIGVKCDDVPSTMTPPFLCIDAYTFKYWGSLSKPYVNALRNTWNVWNVRRKREGESF